MNGRGTPGHARRRHFVTGATSGIGAALVALLHARGDELWLLARSQDRADHLAEMFPRAHILVADLADPVRLEAILATTALPWPLHSLLHIAGVIDFASTIDLPVERLREQLTVNLISPMILSRALLPPLRAGGGLVLFANSTASLNPGSGLPAYVASKGGLRGFADVLRQEEAPRGVRVTSVYPGRTDTPMQRQVHRQENRAYDRSQLLPVSTVAEGILQLIDLPPRASVPDLVIRPAPPVTEAVPLEPSGGAEWCPYRLQTR